MKRITSRIVGFGLFWYRFIIGDDWTVAASIAIGLIATALLNTRRFPAWVVMPIIVIVMVRISVERSTRSRSDRR